MQLRWRATHFPPSPPKKNDGVCLDGEATVGRVLLNDHGPTRGVWMWSMTACAPGVDARAFEASGRLATKEEAKAAVEQAYGRFIAANAKARDHWQKHCAELKARMDARDSAASIRASALCLSSEGS
jgi:hypothetical protein